MDNIIEIKRGLHKICTEKLRDSIAEADKCEKLYETIFLIYGLSYDTETIRQKRAFVAATARYFVLDRLSAGMVKRVSGKYRENNKNFKKAIDAAIDKFCEIYNTSTSDSDFVQKFAEHYKTEVKDFRSEINENRNDSLSNFAKAIEKVYHSEDQNTDC